MIEKITTEIKYLLKQNAPNLTYEQKSRIYKIINPDISNYIIYGVRTQEIENIVRRIYNKINCNYDDAVKIFKNLTRTNNEEEKLAGFHFLNHFKKYFDKLTIDLFRNEYSKYCYTWSVCDSACVRVIGPFLGKKGNEKLAEKTIEEWSMSESNWIKRASMVIFLKITMIKKDFDKTRVFALVDKMLEFSDQNYIGKGIGWLLKTCSKYNPDLIFNYLLNNKKRFSRLILRYASEKLPKEKRDQILIN